MIIPSKLAAASTLGGFKNYLSSSFSVNVPTQNVNAGNFISFTASTALSNTNSISQVQIQYNGLSTDYYIMNGSVTTVWSAGALQVQSYYSFTPTTLSVFTVLVNQSGGVLNVPNITINCRGFLFLAPF